MEALPRAWREFLGGELDSAGFDATLERVAAERAAGLQVFPPEGQLFTALRLTPPEAVRVVLLGQDPYHEPGQANGLAFSVSRGVKLPPSLQNIYKELEADLGVPAAKSGDLTSWAQQGVFLLNTVLSVRAHAANSHKDFGWQSFTDAVIAALAELPQPVAFVLWGAQAQKKAALVEKSPYPRLVLQSPHPSPLSAYRGFFGSRPFSKINAFLEASGSRAIDWRL